MKKIFIVLLFFSNSLFAVSSYNFECSAVGGHGPSKVLSGRVIRDARKIVSLKLDYRLVFQKHRISMFKCFTIPGTADDQGQALVNCSFEVPGGDRNFSQYLGLSFPSLDMLELEFSDHEGSRPSVKKRFYSTTLQSYSIGMSGGSTIGNEVAKLNCSIIKK